MKHDMQTDGYDGDLVVFLLGMQPRRTWRVAQTLFVTRAVFRMQAELERDRAAGRVLGYLGGFQSLTPTGPLLTQYWRSFGDLERYSHAADLEHRPAWLAFYKLTHDDGASRVGLWHETYTVAAGAHESIYVDLRKPVGLGAAIGTQPLERRGATSRERIGA